MRFDKFLDIMPPDSYILLYVDSLHYMSEYVKNFHDYKWLDTLGVTKFAYDFVTAQFTIYTEYLDNESLL